MSANRADAVGGTALKPRGSAAVFRDRLPAARLARNSKWLLSAPTANATSCDPWTIHSLRFFVHGPHRDETLAGLREFALAPRIFDRHWTNRETGEVIPLSALARIDSADPSHPALLPLGEVAATLQSFQWELFPHLRGNRVDVASDHLVPGPCEVCDRIAELRLPYSRLYRGGRNAGELWLSAYHNAGRSRAPGVVVVHYPRLEALLHRRPEADSATIEYCRDRVRQEIRFRGPGLRRRFGGGPMTAEAVFGSFPALVQFAERRLRPVFDADILSPPPRDLPGEAALASVTGSRPGS